MAAELGAGSPLRGIWRGLFAYERNVYLMLFFTLGKGLQLSIAGLVVNLYAYSLGYDKTFIGLLTAVPAIGSLLAAVPTGLLADRIGRKPLILIGSLLNPLALLALGLATHAPALLVASFFNGVCSNAYWVTNLPILVESTSDNQRIGVLAANNFLLLGVGALGSLVGGGVSQFVARALHVSALSTVPLRWGVLVAALVTFLPALPLVFLREPRRAPQTPIAPIAAGDAPRPVGILAEETAADAADMVGEARMGDAALSPTDARGEDTTAGRVNGPTRAELIKLFAKLLVPDALYTTGEAATLALLSLYFALHFHLEPGPLGVFISGAGLIGGAMSFAAPRLARRWGKLQTATASQLLTVPIVLGIGFAPVFSLAYSFEISRNALRGLFEPTYAAFTMEQVSSRHRATLSGFYSVTWSIGFSLGASAAGWLFQHVGYSAAVTLSAICILIAATLLRLWFGRGGAPLGRLAPAKREASPTKV